MRFSIWPDTSRPFSEIAELITHCEASGWDRAYLADHFMPDASANRTDAPVLESWSSLAALAALTSRIQLGTLVSSNTYRHPAVVANSAATIDQISSGRFILGIGAGWQVNVDELIIPDWTMGSLSRAKDTCDQFITDIASSFRDADR